MAANRKQGWVKKCYWGFVQGENFLRHFLLLIIRLYWGGLLIVTGLGKWMNIHDVADYFTALHLPSPLLIAYLVGTTELLGGISLFLGIFSRIFSLFLAIVLIGAYLTAYKAVFINFFTNPSQFIMQDPFLYLYAALVVLCFGPGLFSIDYWLERRSYGKAL